MQDIRCTRIESFRGECWTRERLDYLQLDFLDADTESWIRCDLG